MEKKKLAINCDICDARKIVEENYSFYENILLNADVLLVDGKSKAILSRLPITSNVDESIELADDVESPVQTINGSAAIGGESKVEDHTLLVVNGTLEIKKGSEEVLKKYEKIIVNGSVKYPESLTAYLTQMTVNGRAECYPDDCVVLDRSYVMDSFFPMRAQENAHYYAAKNVIVPEEQIDLKTLAEKNVRFFTKEFVVPEKNAMDCISLIDEAVKMTVIPAGEKVLVGNTTLDAGLLQKNGKKLYIIGNLDITKADAAVISSIEKLTVSGRVSLLPKQQETLQTIDAVYGDTRIVKGKTICNKGKAGVDAFMLEHAEDGVEVANCATVRLSSDISFEQIEERLSIINCATVICSEEQYAAVQQIATNVANIVTEGEISSDNEAGGLAGMIKSAWNVARDTKFVNADQYNL